MNLIDTHTHLYLDAFREDRAKVMDRAKEKGVRFMLLPNIDYSTMDSMMALHLQYPKTCLPMMGLHPTSVNNDFEKELAFVEEQLQQQKYYGVGEIGIDLYWDNQFEEQQREVFLFQLRLAKKHRLPVSIHTRNAFEMVLESVKRELTDDLTGVFHCFTGTRDEAYQIMDTGFKMGIGGIITFKNSGLGLVAKEIPMEYLILETDAPYLTPMPFRGKRNESAYLSFIAEKLAKIKGISVEEVAEQTTMNAASLFHLSL